MEIAVKKIGVVRDRYGINEGIAVKCNINGKEFAFFPAGKKPIFFSSTEEMEKYIASDKYLSTFNSKIEYLKSFKK